MSVPYRTFSVPVRCGTRRTNVPYRTLAYWYVWGQNARKRTVPYPPPKEGYGGTVGAAAVRYKKRAARRLLSFGDREGYKPYSGFSAMSAIQSIDSLP